MITETNAIFINPQAYKVFPDIGNQQNHSVEEKAIYNGFLNILIDNKVVQQFTGTSTIWLAPFSGYQIQIDNVTDQGSVVLGKWDLNKFIDIYIKDAMILWYDVAKQGCTNESMSANPILKDLSGNGRDATCYNFAWSGMSGIGGNFSDIRPSYKFTENGGTATTNGATIHITHITREKDCSAAEYIDAIAPGVTLKPCYFRITGLTNGIALEGDQGWANIGAISKDGIYVTPEYTNTTEANKYPCFLFTEESLNKDCDITIQSLGSYPNAIVSDGVDDYIKTIEAFDLGRNYTVLWNIDWSLQKEDVNTGFYKNSQFYLYNNKTANKQLSVYINTNAYSNIVSNDIIGVSTKNVAYKPDGTTIPLTDYQKVFDSKESTLSILGTTNNTLFTKSSLYSLLIFNRDLTDIEIEWVKQNLMQQ